MIVMILKYNVVNFILNADGTYTVFMLPDLRQVTTATHKEVQDAIDYFTKNSTDVQVVYE